MSKVMIHDLNENDFNSIFSSVNEDIIIIAPNNKISKCIGCFGCWVKTPGSCVIKDGYENMGKLFSQSDELIIISRICYGSFSPFVKNVLDRSIGYILPFFSIRNNQVHHESRYSKRLKLSVLAYGKATQNEKDTLTNIVKANGVNFNVIESSVCFADSINDLPKLGRL